MHAEELEYVGFWPRVVASIIDSVLLLMILVPLMAYLFGISNFDTHIGTTVASWSAGFSSSSWLSHAIGALVVIAFWLYKQATPGKMVIGAHVVDARTGGTLSKGQAIGRYLAYFVSAIPFCLGLVWVAFDSKKQGWHDKLAGTVVVRLKRSANPEPVTFG